MGRTLAIDYGKKRIGIAISDPMGWTAQPWGYLINDSTFLKEFRKILEEKEVDEIVAGYPRQMNGSPGPMAEEVTRFVEKMKTLLDRDIVFWDERLTTAETEKLMISADVRRKDRKEKRDSVAAALILDGYLQSKTRDTDEE